MKLINRCYRLLEVKQITLPDTTRKLYTIKFSFCRSEEFRGGLCYFGPVHTTNQVASQSEGVCAVVSDIVTVHNHNRWVPQLRSKIDSLKGCCCGNEYIFLNIANDPNNHYTKFETYC